MLEEAFILWLFVLSRERSAIFPPPPPPTRTHRRGENKNEKLDPCGENDFLPARLAFFHTAPPGPINTGNHRFSLLHTLRVHDDVMRPKTRRAFFLFLLYFFPSRLLKINSTPHIRAAVPYNTYTTCGILKRFIFF